MRDQTCGKQRQLDMVLCDEAQAIKNPQSKSAQAVMTANATQRIAISGTPIENNMSELWSVVIFANPGIVRGCQFRDHFAEPIAAGDNACKQRPQKRLAPVYCAAPKTR